MVNILNLIANIPTLKELSVNAVLKRGQIFFKTSQPLCRKYSLVSTRYFENTSPLHTESVKYIYILIFAVIFKNIN